MTDHVISVLPVLGGWSVQAPITAQPLMFLSGRRAEEKAKSLGECLAKLGHDARVMIHDRRSTLVGTIRYAAESVEP
jgi:hypothetical protein